jgi:hypothetical protein
VERRRHITELVNFRTKSILAGDLAKQPVWNSKVSNPSGFKLLDIFVNSNFEISAPQHPTHFVSGGRDDILDIVSEVRALDIMDSDHLPIMFCIWIMLRLENFWIQLKNSQTGSGLKASLLP